MAASGWLARNGGGGNVDVVDLLQGDRAKGLAELVDAGALVSLGTTSDGGALGITVTVNGEWRRDYVRTGDELDVWLSEAVPGVTDLLAAEGRQPTPERPSAGRGGRTRRR